MTARRVGGAGYRGGMARQQNPSEDEVEHDFTVPDDADLHPVAHPIEPEEAEER